MPIRRTLLAAIVLFAAACSAGCGASRPVKFYTLSTPPAPATTAAPQYNFGIIVGRIDSSELYRLDHVLYGSGPVERGMYEYDRWASPPVDMIQNRLIAALRATGQYRSVSAISGLTSGDYIVRGHLYDLYGVDKPNLVGRFSMQIDLYQYRNKARTLVWTSSVYNHDQPVQGNTVADVVEALDTNVSQGLQQLTSELGQYFASHPPAAASSQSSD